MPPSEQYSPPAAGALRGVDEIALARVRRRLAIAGVTPWLHDEVGRRMAERLPIVRLQPRQICAWGLAVGGGTAALQAAYPDAALQAVEPDRVLDRDGAAGSRGPARPSPAQALRRWLPWPTPRAPRPIIGCAPDAVVEGRADLLWSNMGLHASADLPGLLSRWHQALAVDGFLMFSTLGPGTLQTLRAVYDAAGWGPPFAPLVDMHDLGDMLVRAGFADPVMDQETLTLTWADPRALLAELRGLGGNVAPGRFAGLRTPRWQQRLEQALQQGLGTPDGRVALPFEVVYGHAFKPAPRLRVAANTEVSLGQMKSMLQARRGDKA